MKQKKSEHTPIEISPGLYLYLALLVLLIPVQWLLALAVSVVIHELGHVLALRLLKLPIYGISCHPAGIKIHTQPLNDVQELVCAAAGPLCGAGLIAFGKWLPGLALVAAFHSLYNLLPVYPADGGRVLQSLSRVLLPGRACEWVPCFAQWVTLGLLIFLGGYGTFVLRLGFLPLVIGIASFVRVMKHK